MLRILVPAMLLALAACATQAGGHDTSSSSEASGGEFTHEGDEQATADALKFGDQNRAGLAEPHYSADEKAEVLAKYTHLDPTDVVPSLLQDNAVQYYHFNKAHLENAAYLTIVDMSIHSGTPRFFVVDLTTGAVESTVVAHGEGSDPDDTGKPVRFSNTNNSLMTSLGYYKTAETYTGQWGFSLRLDGLSATNSIVRERSVVMHGATYVARGKAKQGMSWGCTALPMTEKDAIIRKLKGGSLMLVDSTPLAEARLAEGTDVGDALDAGASALDASASDASADD